MCVCAFVRHIRSGSSTKWDDAQQSHHDGATKQMIEHVNASCNCFTTMTTKATTNIGGEDNFSTRYAIILAIYVNIDHKQTDKQIGKHASHPNGSISKHQSDDMPTSEGATVRMHKT